MGPLDGACDQDAADGVSVNSVKAMRGCIWLGNDMAPFARAIFEAYWGDDQDISQDAVLAQVCQRVGIEPAQFFAGIGEQAIKDQLRANTDEVVARGGFGSPTIFVDKTDMYFGNDRMPLIREAVLRLQGRRPDAAGQGSPIHPFISPPPQETPCKKTIHHHAFRRHADRRFWPGPRAGRGHPGVTDREIKIGSTGPLSGPAAGYGIVGKTMSAWFDLVNAEGGVNGRQLKLVLADDGYSPPKTLEQSRRLVERDQVAFSRRR